MSVEIHLEPKDMSHVFVRDNHWGKRIEVELAQEDTVIVMSVDLATELATRFAELLAERDRAERELAVDNQKAVSF